jgi:hypothetical protein
MPEAGILDYDLAYFDASDLSWEAEDAVIRAGNEIFAGGGSTPRTVCRTCSTSSPGPTRCSRPATSMKLRPRAGGSSGRA